MQFYIRKAVLFIMEEKKQLRAAGIVSSTFTVALFSGILIHLFALTNPLHNYDDVIVQPLGYGTGILSGRWFLQFLGDRAIEYGLAHNTPLMNGLIFLILLAASAALLADTFRMRNKTLAALTGALFVTFPTVASTMFFRYTATYYGLAVLLSVLAVWVLDRCKGSVLLSAVFTALSLGIYQSYTPITIGMMVMLLLRDTLDGEKNIPQIIFRGIRFCIALIAGLGLYLGILKWNLSAWNVQMLDYQGVNTMGQISLSQLPHLLKTAFMALPNLPFQNYCGLASTPVIRLLYLLTGLLTLISIVSLWVLKRPHILMAAFSLVLLLLFPIAVNFIVIMCPSGTIYTLMVYGFVLVPCVPVLLWDSFPAGSIWHKRIRTVAYYAAAVLLSLIICFYAYETNINYTALHFSNRQAENYYSTLVAQVRMTDGYTADKTWAFIGTNQDPMTKTSNWDTTFPKYGGNSTFSALIKAYSWPKWLQLYCACDFPMLGSEETAALIQTEEVKAMPCWPDAGSIKVIGDSVVIKFQELSQ